MSNLYKKPTVTNVDEGKIFDIKFNGTVAQQNISE